MATGQDGGKAELSSMKASFAKIRKGTYYSREQLASLWGYRGYQALARGVVTPRNDNKIILFITEGNRQQQTTQKYSNHFDGDFLHVEGPEDHFAEERVLKASTSGDEIHLFHRETHHSDFTYHGQLRLVANTLHSNKPSEFTFKVL